MYRSLFLILFSPFLALPSILIDIYNRKKYGLVFFSIFIGILAYLFIPSVNMDGAKRYQLYESFRYMSVDKFIYGYLTYRADVIFYSLIYIFAKIGIKLQILLFLIATFNTWVTFFLFHKIMENRNISNATYMRFFLLVFLTLSFQFLFSGVRNLFAFSFVLLGFYQLFYGKKIFIPYLFLTIAVLIHFSAIVYLPVFLLSRTLNYGLLTFVFISLLLVSLFIPKDLAQNILITTETGSEVYDNKIQGYSSTTMRKEETTDSTFLAKQLMRLWWIFAVIYILINAKDRMQLKEYRTVFLFSLPVLVFFAFPGISGRYMYPLKLLFVLLLINDSATKKNTNWQYVFIALLAISPLYDVLRLMSNNFIESYFRLDNLTSIEMLFKTYTYSDMLH